jgi:hypothetical protein
LKVRRTQVILKASSKSCRNPKNRNLQKIETLETLGPKFQNARKFILRVSGGALEKAVLSHAKICLNVQVLGAETLKRRGSYGFSGNPRRVVRFCRRGGMTGKSL